MSKEGTGLSFVCAALNRPKSCMGRTEWRDGNFDLTIRTSAPNHHIATEIRLAFFKPFFQSRTKKQIPRFKDEKRSKRKSLTFLFVLTYNACYLK